MMFNQHRRTFLKTLPALAALSSPLSMGATHAATSPINIQNRWRVIGVGGIGADMAGKFLLRQPGMMSGRVVSVSAVRQPLNMRGLISPEDISNMFVIGLGGGAGIHLMDYAMRHAGKPNYGVAILPYSVDKHFARALSQAEDLTRIFSGIAIIQFGADQTRNPSHRDERARVDNEVLTNIDSFLKWVV